MTSFDERERAFEMQFTHEADLRFRRLARRNKALASWICDRTGKSGAEAAAYQERFLTFAMTASHEAAVAARVADDLAASGVLLPPAEIAAKMAHLDDGAAAQDHA
ncbi:ATPase inhibitor subunit zeta [Lichenihabitans sp. Uapishka_5]|uniref:ATPase inhibitor subunit zeta n=1 Tax=Lichenihabitans sp. Uapishka_5 TaxID=3037302 RepID=UPI0029E8208C|nr:ATPase inhibitor subunit zeta [Lichenihabitans sp. Uapishka_5]MDX7950428.1 ATPase inhibitor subunit zeta [Lichenihabitans sp. Uapishka_5]